MKKRQTTKAAKPGKHGKMSKVRSGSRKPAKASAPKRIARPTEYRRVESAITRMELAHRNAVDRAAKVLAVSDQIGKAAVGRTMDAIVKELADRELLRDIAALREAFTANSRGTIPEELDRLRLLPEALLGWLEERFGLSLDSVAVARECEVPTSRLSRFEVVGTMPTDPNGLVRIRVENPGWSRGGKPLVKPRVAIVE